MKTIMNLTKTNLYFGTDAYDYDAFNLPCHNLPEHADKLVMIYGEKGRFRLQC